MSIVIFITLYAIAFIAYPVTGNALEKEESKVVVACSDFQHPNCRSGNSSSYNEGKSIVKTILEKIKKSYQNVDGLIACGDYCYDTTRSWNAEGNTNVGINAFKESIYSVYSNLANLHLIQGNHDFKTSLLCNFGPNDTDDYACFAINEENFPSKQNSQNAKNIVTNTAASLDLYLSQKANEEYLKPIFISSHVPLHFSTRTQEDSDNIYAKYIYDVCNKYSEDLNIIFLYGHNHAHGDDNYMGGASQFLTYDDSIYIAEPGSNSKYTDEKLNFIYMNAGFVGYYWDNWQTHFTPTNVDTELTMTTFEIFEDKVIIKRWDRKGEHVSLKSVGANTVKKTTDRKVEDKMPIKDKVYENIFHYCWNSGSMINPDNQHIIDLND